jgi:hypothetical protein
LAIQSCRIWESRSILGKKEGEEGV